MTEAETVSATEFKAKCLEILDRVGRGEVERVAVTKRGRVVAVLVPPAAEAKQVEGLHGFLRGSVLVPDSSIAPSKLLWDVPRVQNQTTNAPPSAAQGIAFIMKNGLNDQGILSYAVPIDSGNRSTGMARS